MYTDLTLGGVQEYFSEPPGRDIDATPDYEDAGAKDDEPKNDRPTVSHKEVGGHNPTTYVIKYLYKLISLGI